MTALDYTQVAAEAAEPAKHDVLSILGPGGAVSQLHPAYEARRPQIQIANAIEDCIKRGVHGVFEAGTGTGKSLAYLIPAILASLRYNGPKVLVSTADKNLQNQLVKKDLPFLQRVFASIGKTFTYVLLKGRSNFVCRFKVEELRTNTDFQETIFKFQTQEASENLKRTLEWVDATYDGDLDEAPFDMGWELRNEISIDGESCLNRECKFFDTCHFEARKAEARAANVIVVNNALLYRDLQIRYITGGLASVIPLPKKNALGKIPAMVILDEAQKTEDDATDAFAVEVTLGRFYHLTNRIKRYASGDAGWHSLVVKLLKSATHYFGQWEDRLNLVGKKSPNPTIIIDNEVDGARDLIDSLAELVKLMDDPKYMPGWLDKDEKAMWAKIATTGTNLLTDLVNVVRSGANRPPDKPETWLRYAEQSGKRAARGFKVTLSGKPIEIGPLLKTRLWDVFPTIIATSATLAVDGGFAAWRASVGAPKSPEAIVAAPFNYAKNMRIYLPREPLSFDPGLAFDKNGAPAYYDRLAREVLALVDASDGGAFVLFTSRRVLDEVYNRCEPLMAKRWPLIYHGLTTDRGGMIRDFRTHGNAVLFGLKSFWQGVDIQGHALRLVIIDKLPFPPPGDPIWDARCDAVVARTGNKFGWLDALSVPACTIDLKQGVGRLIRAKDDYGVIALLDGRLVFKYYGPTILTSLPQTQRIRDVATVKQFFDERKEMA